jgi:hypothetical protein
MANGRILYSGVDYVLLRKQTRQRAGGYSEKREGYSVTSSGLRLLILPNFRIVTSK